MPWEHCDQTLGDELDACPSCGIEKAAWTLQWDATRTFQVPRRSGRPLAKLSLLDAAGASPIVGQPFRVAPEGGAPLEGQTDEWGYGKVELPAEGPYRLSLPGVAPDQLAAVEPEAAADAEADALALVCRTGPKYEVRLRQPVVLCFQRLGEPLASAPYRLRLGGEERRGALDARGELRFDPPAGVAEAEVWVGEGEDLDHYRVALGELAPVGEVRGAQQRLNNLGFYAGREDDALGPVTRSALVAFQREHGLEPSGRLDPPSQTKLVEVHGG